MDFSSGLINCLPIGVVLTQEQGRIFHCNQVMADWFCLDPQQVQGNSITEFWPELATYLRWQEAGGRVRLSTPAGWLMMRVLVQKFPQETQGGLVWSFVPEHSRDLEQSQQEFIDTISHELRTPLTSIKGFVDTLLHSQSHFSYAQTRHFLEIVQTQVTQLSALVEAVLAVSRWQVQPGHFRPVRVAELVPEVMLELALQPGGNRVDWRIQELSPVWSDPELLVPILVQVLDYALTHTPGDTQVQVRGWPGGTGLQIGVPELDLGELWYPLGPTRPGMGLYVAQMLVERLEGRLLLGQGLTLELPRVARMASPVAGLS
ncbi:two-component sensor histidine kinase [Gloeomargarita lithophora Alchichica-D10]|uniref:histidine kinase n=1 Tax=Gloeomargarita lithophora Alchichica-D10 TaxID=1188229 RepID=A0A1J0A9E3_9CYAN|nr:PAS domain-containing sensor histidine kinase [Gloeomargarita lithophora]APB32541.1 two-component sensor histidine kinase [Gloeomargarita lithophora Alchichica-D10]